MKQIELELKERLLIVESDNFDETQLKEEFKITFFHNGNVLKFICKGSELTEQIAKGLTHSMNFGTYQNPDIGFHNSIKNNYWCSSALDSFKSAIESQQDKTGIKLDLEKCLIFKEL